jgi:DNA-directed RNA polymerase specialized sigma24 family protein
MSHLDTSHSISLWLSGLKTGELAAAERLWRRYSERLLDAARTSLRDAPKVGSDEHDIAQSVFRNICSGAVQGRFSDVRNRDELWWLLLSITQQKVVDHIRRETAAKRGGGKVVREADFCVGSEDGGQFTLDALVGDEPTPEFVAMLEEETQQLLGALRDDLLRKVALARIEGYTVPEIAQMLSISTRSVERKLKLIRSSWANYRSELE